MDRSLVHGLGRDEDDSAIVSAVISMARALGLATVAEGVETGEQLMELRALRSDLAQGYYFAKPQPLEDLLSVFVPLASRESAHAPQI